MSRVGKHPVVIPSGVKVDFDGVFLKIEGAKGALSMKIPGLVKLDLTEESVAFSPVDDTSEARANWGTVRSIVSGMVQGVSSGYVTVLEINGVGYRAEVRGDVLKLSLGYSHQICYIPPKGIEIKVPKQTEIEIHGYDKQLVGQVAAEIKSFRKTEPYKGKGVKIKGESIRRKEGKKK